jgi:hypothetical protein
MIIVHFIKVAPCTQEARFMILKIKRSLVPSPERIFRGEVKEAATRASFETNTLDDLSVIGAWLVFQEKLILEQREAWRNSQESFTKMDEDGKLKD